MNIAGSFLFHTIQAALGRKSFRHPLGVYCYLTFRCNLHCSYCDGGSGTRFPDMTCPELAIEDWKPILRVMGQHTRVLMLSGGEPLLYQGLPDLLDFARTCGFSFISLNTNGLLLDETIVGKVDAIIVSLDSLDRQTSDRLWSRSGATTKVLEWIDRLARRKHPSLMINSVIMPDNLDDVADILDFCRRHDITFSAGPALRQTRPVPGLQGNLRYQALMDKILAAKKSGQRIAATVDYLKGVKRFRGFDCHPLLVWRVYPNGDLVYPCSRLNRLAGNLRRDPDPLRLFTQAAGGDTFQVNCGETCPLSCYMDPSFMIQRPLGLIREGLYRLRTFTSGHRLTF